MSEKRVSGPIQVFVIGFEKFNETGMILAELRRVRKRGVIRVVDLLFVQKDKRGNISSAMHLTDLSEDERQRLGAVAGGLIGLQAGVTTFDASVAGLGGCPYAPGAAGNLATEDLVYTLHGMGIETGIDLEKLWQAGQVAEAIVGRELPGKVHRAGVRSLAK